MIIAIDFDGTIVTHMYPKIGQPIDGAIETIKILQNAGHKIILYTMRSGQPLNEAIQYLVDNDIHLWSVNKNPEQIKWTQSPKVYAPLYIDDAALGCPLKFDESSQRMAVDWGRVNVFLHLMNIL